MRVGIVGINSTNLLNNRYKLHSKVSAPNMVFRGIFGSPDVSEKFRYGLEALDEHSLLVVTSNEEIADMILSQNSDKIDTPILKKYTLNVEKKDLKNKITLDSDFVIFKKQDKFFIMGVGNLFPLTVQRPKEDFDSDKHQFKAGLVKELRAGEEIRTGELLWGEKPKFVSNPPYKYNPSNAEKYLKVKSITNLKEFNKRTVTSLCTETNTSDDKKVFTFADIGGLDEAIATLKKYVVRPINYPKVFENIRLNKGILLWGPPRCGKTLLGKALASETGAKYREFNANEFKSAQVGASEASIRDVFQKAMADAPSITFIDEFDSIAKTRDGSSNARFDDPIVNQFLGCMSDLEKSKAPAFIVAATNMKNLIDPALLASGRFGLHIEIPMPNLEGLKQIFKIHSKNQPLFGDVSVDKLVTAMFENKFNGADVAEMITDAFFNAIERLGLHEKMDARTFGFEDLKKILISNADFEKALERLAKQKL